MALMIDLLQWPAMLLTIAAAWCIGSCRPGRRRTGFCCFIASNVLWVIWGLACTGLGVNRAAVLPVRHELAWLEEEHSGTAFVPHCEMRVGFLVDTGMQGRRAAPLAPHFFSSSLGGFAGP
jgi:hypothetical protein